MGGAQATGVRAQGPVCSNFIGAWKGESHGNDASAKRACCCLSLTDSCARHPHVKRHAVWNSAAYKQNKFLRQHGVIAQLTMHSLRQPYTLPPATSAHHLDAKVGGLAGVQVVVVGPGGKGHGLQRNGSVLQGVLDACPHDLGVQGLQRIERLLPDRVLWRRQCVWGCGL